MKIIIRKNDDGFLATCPDIKGAFAEGETKFEAFYNLVDVIKMISEYRKDQEKHEEIGIFSEGSSEFEIPILA